MTSIHKHIFIICCIYDKRLETTDFLLANILVGVVLTKQFGWFSQCSLKAIMWPFKLIYRPIMSRYNVRSCKPN